MSQEKKKDESNNGAFGGIIILVGVVMFFVWAVVLWTKADDLLNVKHVFWLAYIPTLLMKFIPAPFFFSEKAFGGTLAFHVFLHTFFHITMPPILLLITYIFGCISEGYIKSVIAANKKE